MSIKINIWKEILKIYQNLDKIKFLKMQLNKHNKKNLLKRLRLKINLKMNHKSIHRKNKKNVNHHNFQKNKI
jgi:hypothetical protein